jgi:hypothetical protein
VEPAEQEINAAIADVYAEVVFGDVLDVLGLINNHVLIVGQDGSALLFERKVAKHQGVVCDDDIGAIGSASGPLVEALLEMGALSPAAVSVLAVDCVPDGAAGDKGDVT